MPKQTASETDAVNVLFNVAAACTPCNHQRQLGARVDAPLQAIGNINQAPGVAWSVGPVPRPHPYSLTSGPFSTGLKFTAFGGPVAGIDAKTSAFVAVMFWMSAHPDAVFFGEWENKRRGPVNSKQIDTHAWGPASAPSKRSAWAIHAVHRAKKAVGSDETQCEYDNHSSKPHAKRLRLADVAPLSGAVHKKVGCTECFVHSCAQLYTDVVPEQPKKHELKGMPCTARALAGKAKPGALKTQLKKFFRSYRLVHRAGAIDPRHYGASTAEIERHGTAIAECFWMFDHVYADRSASLMLYPGQPLKALRRTWLCVNPRQTVSTGTGLALIASMAPALNMFGRAKMPRKLRRVHSGEGNPMSTASFKRPWVYWPADGSPRLCHTKELFIFNDDIMVTRAYISVWNALMQGLLCITIQLTPPVESADLQPPAPADAVDCLTTVNVKVAKHRQVQEKRDIAGRIFPDDFCNAQYITYEKLALLLEQVRRAVYEAGGEGDMPVLSVNLIGSYSEAVNGREQAFGPTRVCYGGAFMELVSAAIRAGSGGLPLFKDTLRVIDSPYCDTTEYCHMDNEYEFICDVTTGERQLRGNSVDVCIASSRTCYERHGRQTFTPVDGGLPPHCAWEDATILRQIAGIKWDNETPNQLMAVDAASMASFPKLD